MTRSELPLILNLERYVRLSADDRDALRELYRATLIEVPPRTELAREGDNPTVVRLMVSGWASRYKDLPDGRRQIVGFLIPGDFCDLNVYILQVQDHSIGALTAVEYLAITPEVLQHLIDRHPRVGQALLWHELVSSSIQREWILNVGKRTALERLAHLFIEIYMRLNAVGSGGNNTCWFPVTQNDLADATGITAVHLNRMLQDLRSDGLVELRAKRLTILDMERLQQLAMFNPNYLHLGHEGRHLNAND